MLILASLRELGGRGSLRSQDESVSAGHSTLRASHLWRTVPGSRGDLACRLVDFSNVGVERVFRMPVPAARRCIPKGRALSNICRRGSCRRAGGAIVVCSPRWCREHEGGGGNAVGRPVKLQDLHPNQLRLHDLVWSLGLGSRCRGLPELGRPEVLVQTGSF